MRHRPLAVLGLTALATGLLPVAAAQAAPPPATRQVDDNGIPCQSGVPVYTSIQAAVDAASTGEVVRVCPGVYAEDVVVGVDRLILRGARYGVSGLRRATTSDSGESIVEGSITLAANSDRIDGFIVRDNATGPGIVTQVGVSGHLVYNNVIQGNVFGVYLGASGAIQSEVKRNLVRDNNTDGAAAGNGIYTDNGVANATIQGNRFVGHINAGVIFADAGAVTRNVTVAGNSFADESNGDVSLFAGTNMRITGNTMTNAVGNPAGGSSIFMTNVNGVVVQGNRITRANFSGIAVRADSDSVTVTRNTVSRAGGNGIDVSTALPGAVTVGSNQLSDNGEAGIIMQAGTSGNVLRYNRAFGNVTVDCQDDTVGGQRAGVANAWATSNRGVTSSPAGLCRP